MKSLKMLIVATSFVSSAVFAGTHDHGFCVSLDEELTLENAFLVVRDQIVSEGRPYHYFQGEDFFNLNTSKARKIMAADWSGSMSLEKIGILNGIIYAGYRNFMHGFGQEKIVLKCLPLIQNI